MKRRRWIWAGVGIGLAALASAWVWVPRSAVNYLNRPETDVRRKISESLSSALGEPIEVGFRISDAGLTARFHLEVQFADIHLSSPTIDLFQTSVESATVDVPLWESFRTRRVILGNVTVRIPSVSLERDRNGVWPFLKIRDRMSASGAPDPTGRAAAEAPSESRVEVRSVEIQVDSARVRSGSDFGEVRCRLSLKSHWSVDPETTTVRIDSARIEQIQTLADSLPIELPAVEFSGEIIAAKNQPLKVHPLVLGSGADRITLHGDLTSPLNVRVQTDQFVDLDRIGLMPLLAARMPQVRIQRAQASLDIGVSGSAAAPKLDGTFTIRADQLSYRDIPIDNPVVEGRLTPSGLRSQISGRLFEGKFTARFSVPPHAAGMDITGKLSEARLAALGAFLPKKNVKLSGQADAAANLKQVSGDLRRVRGPVSISGRNVEISGLPTFGALAQSLNEIAAAVGKIGEGSLTELFGSVKGSARKAVSDQGTTAFDEVTVSADISNGTVRFNESRFSNSEMRITASGTAGLESGSLDLVAQITFLEPALQTIESSFARDILAKGVRLPVRGTLMNPVFDKESFLKQLLRQAGRKLIEGKLGDLLFKNR